VAIANGAGARHFCAVRFARTFALLVIAVAGSGCGAVSGRGGAVDAGAGGPSRSEKDAAPFQPMASHPNPNAYRQAPGGQVSASDHYRAVRTVPAPPAPHQQQSERYRMVGGIVSATR
jgi:hypothetical protein